MVRAACPVGIGKNRLIFKNHHRWLLLKQDRGRDLEKDS
jgi:hypothetical protein